MERSQPKKKPTLTSSKERNPGDRVGGKQNPKEERKMDYKVKRRKIFKTPEAKELDGKHNDMQANLDRLGYESPKENQNVDDYVKSLSW